jgi:predicted phosphoribosyltransferase
MQQVMRFRDRRHAGQDLAARLKEWADGVEIADPLVLALPRGGLPVAVPVAEALHASLDVLVVRKIGVPGRPESGIGAVTGEDPPLFDRQALEMLGLSEGRLAADVDRERAELRRREQLYRRGRPAPVVRDRFVFLVDDGLATGATARAALRHLRRQEPAQLILAVPVAAADTVARMRAEADDLLCPYQPADFRAVGEWYENFEQVEDGEVIEILHGGPGTPGT